MRKSNRSSFLGHGNKETGLGLFGRIGAFLIGAAVIAALWFHSIVPVVLTGVGMIISMGFFNGLS